MMPITLIAEHYAVKTGVVDVESIGARMEYHKWWVHVTNSFLSDVGGNWCVELRHMEEERDPIEVSEPSLRSAMIKALYAAADARTETNGEKQWLKHRVTISP